MLFASGPLLEDVVCFSAFLCVRMWAAGMQTLLSASSWNYAAVAISKYKFAEERKPKTANKTNEAGIMWQRSYQDGEERETANRPGDERGDECGEGCRAARAGCGLPCTFAATLNRRATGTEEAGRP